MPGNKVVVDTNIFIDIMNGLPGLKEKINSYREVYISPVVLAELYFGAYYSGNPGKQLKRVNLAIEKSKLLTIDEATVDTFVAIKIALYAKGKPIPENDIWIASSAIQHQIPLCTNDRHFSNIDGLILN